MPDCKCLGSRALAHMGLLAMQHAVMTGCSPDSWPLSPGWQAGSLAVRRQSCLLASNMLTAHIVHDDISDLSAAAGPTPPRWLPACCRTAPCPFWTLPTRLPPSAACSPHLSRPLQAAAVLTPCPSISDGTRAAAAAKRLGFEVGIVPALPDLLYSWQPSLQPDHPAAWQCEAGHMT